MTEQSMTPIGLSKIVREFEEISATTFWKLYHEKILELRNVELNRCETDEIVARAQGAARAYKTILGGGNTKPLAERILDELQNKGEK